jgi:glycosyltransferase involved in cell wall biosynthesis
MAKTVAEFTLNKHMAKIFIVDLEAVDTRYTEQWKYHVPQLLKKTADIEVICGPTNIPSVTTPGAFLNFGGTNIYKSSQVEQMGRLFCSGSINAGDHFLFTDAWHPGIINLKYMSELLQIPVTIHALWHAGSYDPQDFLGRLIGDAPWVRHAEQSFFHAIDHNYFATDFHIDLFAETFSETVDDEWKITMIEQGKIVRSGWPMEYMVDTLENYNTTPKRELILFPHRLAPEKQVEIFRDLAKHLPQYEFVVCQDTQLDKHEYHKLLGRAKIVFSANLQETLGISCYEGAIVDAIPMVPDRLSYTEMYNDMFKYPSEWTESFEAYEVHRQDLCYKIVQYMNNHDQYKYHVRKQASYLTEKFFSANVLTAMFK